MGTHSGFTAISEINFSGTNHAGLKVNSLTTTQRNALTPANGMLIYNTTTNAFEKYENGNWVSASKSAGTLVVAPATSGFAADYYTDGTTDQVEIQAALDAVYALGGGTVLLKAGTYTCSASIRMQSNCRLLGEGWATVIKMADGAWPSERSLIESWGALDATTLTENIIVSNFAIDGNDANVTGTDPRDGIEFRLTAYGIMENIYVYNHVDSPLVLNGPDTHHCIIRNCVIDTCNDIGIYVSGSPDNLIEGNIVRNTNSYGIRNVNSGAGRNAYINNYLENVGLSGVNGMQILNGDLCRVIGNMVRAAGLHGINSQSAYTTISGNVVYFSQQHGIICNGAQRNTISGNTIHQSSQLASNTYSGIYLNDAADCTITGNRSGDSGATVQQKYGLEEAGTSDNNIISSNMFDRNQTGSMLIVGPNTIYGLNREE